MGLQNSCQKPVCFDFRWRGCKQKDVLSPETVVESMTKLEHLNVFLNDRLTAAAAEIFRAVKDTVLEYQSEILRSKEENERLKRLLNVAVQRLLLQSEPHSVQAQEDSQLRESESGKSARLLSQVKDEQRNIQTDCLQQVSNSEDGNCSNVELVRFHPPPAQTVSLPPLICPEVKTKTGRKDNRKQLPSNSLSSSMTIYSTQNDSCATTAKTHMTLRNDQQVKGLLRSNGKKSVHILQIKNARSLKPPPSHPDHPSQSIQRWHSCNECGKGFNFACQLEVHMRWHTKEKPYSCSVCRKSFTTVSMLKRHHRIHTGEKPFRCHVCGKCFNQSAHLNTHFRLHTRERASWNRASQCK